MTDSDKLLTPEQVADRLQIRPQTVQRHLREGGRLHHLRIKPLGSKTIRVRESALNQYIESSAS